MKRRNEWEAWLATGIDLPADLADLRDELERLEQVYEQTKSAADVTPAAHSLIRDGADPADAVLRARTATAETVTADEQQKAAHLAVTGVRRRLHRAVAASRETLIANAAPVVADIIEQATPLAATLDKFGTVPDADQIARDGTPAELKAWRNLEALDQRLRTIRRAWLTTWRDACSGAGQHRGAQTAPRHHAPGVPGGLHVWADPHAVTDDKVRHGATVHVAAIARHHPQGRYRLAGLQQLTDLVASLDVEQPHGRRRRIRVYVPKQQPKRRNRRTEPQPSARFL